MYFKSIEIENIGPIKQVKSKEILLLKIGTRNLSSSWVRIVLKKLFSYLTLSIAWILENRNSLTMLKLSMGKFINTEAQVITGMSCFSKPHHSFWKPQAFLITNNYLFIPNRNWKSFLNDLRIRSFPTSTEGANKMQQLFVSLGSNFHFISLNQNSTSGYCNWHASGAAIFRSISFWKAPYPFKNWR